MAGYSGSPTARKLGIKEGGHLLLVRPLATWQQFDLPAGSTVEVAGDLSVAGLDAGTVVLAFFQTVAAYLEGIGELARLIFPDASLWIAWPRRAGGHVSDLTDVRIRDAALPLGLVDNKVAAIDDAWSGLRFTWRRELRPGS
jgi:hypothetical protein